MLGLPRINDWFGTKSLGYNPRNKKRDRTRRKFNHQRRMRLKLRRK